MESIISEWMVEISILEINLIDTWVSFNGHPIK